MESCGRYIVLVMTFEVATHFLKCISCSITPQTPVPVLVLVAGEVGRDQLDVPPEVLGNA